MPAFFRKAIVGLFLLLPMAVAAEEIEVLSPSAYRQVLQAMDVSGDDVDTYKAIFKALANENFKKADALAEKLDNPVLMGHVLAEKYLSKKYSSSYLELQDWLEKYSDHPQAKRIYSLALKKGTSIGLAEPKSGNNEAKYAGYKKQGKQNYNFVVKNLKNFQKYINRGKTLRARLILENKTFKKLASKQDYDAMSAQLAFKYFLDNYDKLAFTWASAASKRSGNATASWVAGLSSWRMKQYKNAAYYFSRLGDSGNSDEWLVSAGNYWAYRAYKKLNMNLKAQQRLEQAANYRRTFYGMLAEYQLGGRLEGNWTALSYLNDFNTDEYMDELLQSPSIRRALVLIKAQMPELAEAEFKYDFENMTDSQKEAGLYIAAQFKMHSLAIMISNKLKDEQRQIFYDPVAYPVPKWQPQSGWLEDRALLLALARQESSFSPKAKSAAGACGLMQLLPSTAAHISKNKSLRKNYKKLEVAEYNLELGQQYVSYLLDKPFINGNLFYMMTAYNAGPGNLYKWLKTINDGGDPLMFIEAVPARETRIYIERVTANYWMYNSRFNQDNYTLEEVAKGEFPILRRNKGLF